MACYLMFCRTLPIYKNIFFHDSKLNYATKYIGTTSVCQAAFKNLNSGEESLD